MISDDSQRVLIKENAGASLVDITSTVNDFRTSTHTFTLDTDGFIYVGQYLPFNSRYFDISSPSGGGATLAVEVWNGSQWLPTVDERDRTDAYNSSGYLKYSMDQDEAGWQCSDTDEIDGLENGPQIYKFFWMRISTDTLLGEASVNYIGNLFSSDDELYSYYPALDNQITRDQWDTTSPGTKVDWLEQGFMTSEMIVRDLKTRDEIRESGQILDAQIFNTPSIHQQAVIIFGGLGRGFEDDKKGAQSAYDKAMKLSKKNLDKWADARLTPSERVFSSTFAKR